MIYVITAAVIGVIVLTLWWLFKDNDGNWD